MIVSAQATVPTENAKASEGFRQPHNLLLRDISRDSAQTIDVNTASKYITPISGTANESTVTILLRLCPEVGYGSFLQCIDEKYGVLQVDRKPGATGAEVRELPKLGSGYQAVAFDGTTIRAVGTSLIGAMESLNSGDPAPKATTELVASTDGGEFVAVNSRETTNLKPCFTEDGSLWDLDPQSKGLLRLAPTKESSWTPYADMKVEPGASFACGGSNVAVLNALDGSGFMFSISNPSKIVPLEKPSFETDPFTAASISVEFDSVDQLPYVVGSGTVYGWDSNGARTAEAVAAQVTGLPRASGRFWISRSTDEPKTEEVR